MRTDLLAVGLLGGSRLAERIESLLKSRAGNPARSRLLGGLFSAALFVAIVAGTFAPRWIAFAQRLEFEVASIKPADPVLRSHFIGTRSGSFIATDHTLKQLVGMAYDLRDHQISGGPKWLDSDRYYIEGKPDSATPIPPGPAGMLPARLMVQQLLADRFKLAVHRETREEQVFELVAAKGGPKLKEADLARTGPRGIQDAGSGRLRGMAATLDVLTSTLAQVLSRSVIDRTGLTGRYDFVLDYTPELGQLQLGPPGPPDGPGPLPPDPNGPSLFTAVQEQLGLKLQSARGPVEILVIDHAEKPDAN